MNIKKNNGKLNATKIVLGLFFVATVFLPLSKMFLFITQDNAMKVLSSTQFKTALFNTLKTSLTASILSLTLAMVLSWCITRTNIKHKKSLVLLLTLPMFIPSISHGMGIVILLGKNGILNNLFQLNINIYGFWGIVLGSILYSFPVSLLMFNDTLAHEDYTSYEAATMLGFSSWDKFKKITFPYLRKPLIGIFFANFTLIVTDYGVPLIVGGKTTTLPVLMYKEVIGLLDFSKGAVIGSVLLVPAFIAFLFDVLNKDKGNLSFTIKQFDIKENKTRDTISKVLASIVIFCISLPLFAFVFLAFTSSYPYNTSFTFKNVLDTMNMGGGKYLFNSLLISVFVSLLGTILAYGTAYFTTRIPTKSSKVLHFISIATLAIPGLVLGLSYSLFFQRSVIYGTLVILILVNMVHFFASPYLMIYNSLGKLNSNLEDVGATLGISRLKIIKDVLIPQTKDTVAEMVAYFFVNSMVTISAVSFLATVNNKPLSIMINQFEGNMMIEASAFVSLIIFGVNIVMKIGVELFKKRKDRKKQHAY